MNIPLVLVALFLIAHGLIHLSYLPAARPKNAPYYPFQLEHSRLLVPLGLDRLAHSIGLGLMVLTVGGFSLTALGLLGVPVLATSWQTLALASAFASLLLLILFWNWMLTLGIVIDAAIILAVLWNPSPLPALALAVAH